MLWSKMRFDYSSTGKDGKSTESSPHGRPRDLGAKSFGDILESGSTVLVDNRHHGTDISVSELAWTTRGLLGFNTSSFLVVLNNPADRAFIDLELSSNVRRLLASLAHANDLSSEKSREGHEK